MIPGILSGVKVVEFGQNLAGPYCGQILAFLGADVVKVERPEGDDARKWGPPFIEGDATGFIALNRGKQSITVDLADAAQRQALIERIGQADVFVHNLRADVPPKFGIDGASLAQRFPHLIYADLGAFGHTGPWAQRPGYEPIIQAVAGLISLNGDPGGPPARVGVSIIDLSTGMWTAIGVLAALWRKAQTGQGCIVNTSLFETGLMWASNHIAGYTTTGTVAPRQGTGHPSLTPYQAFECSDGPLMICPGNDRLWRKFAEVLGHPEWPDDPRFLTNALRMQHRPLLLGMIGDIMKGETRATWSARLDKLGVPNGPLNSVPDVMALAQVAALAMFSKPFADAPTLFHGLPISFDGQRAGDDSRAPRIGEHNPERSDR
ncbi:CaiB/BaiF CoA-transferase family protein [Reyranella sp. CPCC 100927]|uniref:CaiB/BaiF CoA transferase family protein n=1 Tax=Reyranella sp. CPCC 100927 TaxID=2599616 RepID=UPI001C499ECE|nr:CoA transferase [Reyranella sp. CPCC 100927]